uniref:NADH-ubiquinone oxidoreductase chain 2 n=1 Tax=Rheocricotopus villiculus TaxID=2781637 RepID=A0A8A9WQV7_9DIPT|nr:NADH dehydrogenase subunit 2 [Rheocricotopus villiculus]QTT60906.1 NADH dehydrogenase subunit 2 [Rheocricotopus villiculus]
MFKNSYKFLFFNSMIIGSLISISASSWFSVWMGLEINLLSLIPLIMMSKNLFSSESSLKYFLIQAIASAVLLFSIIIFFLFMNLKYENNFIYSSLLINSSMMLKCGAAPFHFWLPSVMEGLTWMNNFLLMTWQKIAPLMILSYMMNFKLLIFSIFMAMIFGSLGGLNQTSLRKLMAFSSINHLGWMLAGMIFNQTLWLIYFFIYFFLNMSITFMLNNFKIFNINQTFTIFKSNKFLKLMLFLPLLSLGGLPPFLGFFPKWLIIEMLIKNNLYFLLNFMLFLTLITLYFYLRISYSTLLFNFSEMNWNYKLFIFKKNFLILSVINFISIFGLILIFLMYYLI